MKQLAIFASGSGSNAENITRLFHQGNRVKVSVVLCNRRDAQVFERMKPLGVPVIYIPNSSWESDPERVIETLRPYEPDMIVLAGFMRAVRPEIIDFVGGHVVNIHPALLPAYGGKGMYGHHVHEAVIAAGETRSGATVHYVTEEIDGGEIIMQKEVEVTPQDTPDTLAEKVHEAEYDLYPRAIVKALESVKERESKPAPVMVASPAPEKPARHTPPSPLPEDASADEAWAQTLHIKYSDAEAEKARLKAENSTATPPVPGQGATPPPATGASVLHHPAVAEALARGEKLPKSYMWVSVVMAVLFSTIPGIIAIVFSATVSSRLSCGDIKGAEDASRKAQGWIIASFVLGMLAATLWVPATLISGM